MSDDEEVVIQGSDLYKYLIDQGFCDFDSLRLFPSNEGSSPVQTDNKYCSYFNDIDQQLYHTQSKSNAVSVISEYDYHKIQCVLRSQLLFKEDVDILETMFSTKCVHKNSLNLYSYVSTGISGLILAGIAIMRPRSNYYINTLAVACTTFSAWLLHLKYLKSHEDKIFRSHVSLLQDLCSNIHKIFRFIKETEIISTGQVSMHNIGIASYSQLPIGMGLHQSEELVKLPSWKTLPHLRRCLADSVIVTVQLLNQACVNLSLREVFEPMTRPVESVNNQTYLQTVQDIVSNDPCISLKKLQYLNDIYLAVQSEYLKSVALSLFSVKLNSSIRPIANYNKNMYTIISHLQSELSIISLNLVSKYHIHNSSNLPKSNHSQVNQNHDTNKKLLQIEVHNAYLLMLSVLLRMRSLEDFLADNTSKFDDLNKLNKEVSIQLTSVKDDLRSAVQCYDTIYSRFVTEEKLSHPEEKEMKHNKIVLESKSKKTGIEVGKSDFNVNSPDEVFLAISNINNQETDFCADDWTFETKPQIPKNLLKELCNTLKSRKQDFNKREKIALERKGQQDIDDSFDSSSSEESTGIEYKKKTVGQKTCKNVLNSDNEHSSENEVNNGSKITKKKSPGTFTSYKKLQTDSSSDSEESFSDTGTNNYISTNPTDTINNSTLANLIAMKSQMWKKREEECFSDG